MSGYKRAVVMAPVHLVVLDLRAAAEGLPGGVQGAAMGVIAVLRESRCPSDLRIADQIEAQVPPPKPQVYKHLAYRERGEAVEAVCGKTWIPDADANVIGTCAECQRVVEKGWTS